MKSGDTEAWQNDRPFGHGDASPELIMEGRLYEVEMANGYRAYAILEKKGPVPDQADPTGEEVVVDYSPFDMSKCKVVEWCQ